MHRDRHHAIDALFAASLSSPSGCCLETMLLDRIAQSDEAMTNPQPPGAVRRRALSWPAWFRTPRRSVLGRA
jgi:hypothetical protein